MLKDFREFIARGNVIDLAVGVIIGGAFGKIVTSLVNDVIMPLIGIVIGGINFKDLSVTLGEASIKYGMFIQNVVDFLIIAFCIFLFIRILAKFKKEKPQEATAPPPTSKEAELLSDIKDLLQARK